MHFYALIYVTPPMDFYRNIIQFRVPPAEFIGCVLKLGLLLIQPPIPVLVLSQSRRNSNTARQMEQGDLHLSQPPLFVHFMWEALRNFPWCLA